MEAAPQGAAFFWLNPVHIYGFNRLLIKLKWFLFAACIPDVYRLKARFFT